MVTDSTASAVRQLAELFCPNFKMTPKARKEGWSCMDDCPICHGTGALVPGLRKYRGTGRGPGYENNWDLISEGRQLGVLMRTAAKNRWSVTIAYVKYEPGDIDLADGFSCSLRE